MSSLVSIITPTYNHEKYIAECIKSVLAQTYQNWEMIIVDDGSTDKTAAIIKSFADPRIKYIRNEHLGGYQLGRIYNQALSQAKGEFIAILEGDDFWPHKKLEIQLPHFSSDNIVLTYGDCILTNENSRKLFYRQIPADKSIANNYPVGSALNELANAQNFIYAQTVIIRKSALDKIGGFIQPDYLYLVDYPTLCRLSLAGEFRGIPKVLGYWRRNINSLTMNKPLIVSDGFIRYISEFAESYKAQIGRQNINIEELRKQHQVQLLFAQKHQDYAKGVISLIYGYNQAARSHFKLYIKQPETKLFYKIISISGVMLSYTPLLKIILPLFGIYFSRPLAALKRLLLSPRAHINC